MLTIKTKEEIAVMRKGGRLLASVFDILEKEIRVGMPAEEMEYLADKTIASLGGKPGFKGQGGFPSSLCFSINDEIVHGIPRNKVLKEGDVLTLDFGIFFKLEKFIEKKIDPDMYPNLYDGFHTDMARTYIVGDETDSEVARLVRATKKTLKRGIKKVHPGITVGDIGETMFRFADSQGFSIIKALCGHGIGAELHEDPEILNYGKRHTGVVLKEGMVFCIEPMLSMGNNRITKGKDGFSFVTEDGSITAHFEHMVAVTKDGFIVLTE
ncbi:MAG: type I methionyl aminopeptidase [Candidatus Pacebacteria bacterium]|nr:type I methionyl aminopeptidase [Candidatus Paceibacterota bacterium]